MIPFERIVHPENFRLERPGGQNVLRFLPDVPFAEARLFMRGPLLDGTGGKLNLLQERLAPLSVGTLPLLAPRQVHGVVVLPSDRSLALPSQPDADGILLTSFEVEASLRFGDCAPVLVLPSPEWVRCNRPWALLLHSGYKGTVLNIVRAGLLEVERVMGGDAVRSASAWVGPCVSGDSYPRTMEEWTERGLAVFHPENVRRAGDGHVHFDLAGELRRQLTDCGLDGGRIFLSGMDTVAEAVCYSHRRGEADRMFLHARLVGRGTGRKTNFENLSSDMPQEGRHRG